MKKKFPFWVLAAIVSIIGIVNGAADYWHLYFYYRWLDIPMHVFGGFWVALSALAIAYQGKFVSVSDHSNKMVFIIAVMSAFIVGAGWELYEWGVDEFLQVTHTNFVDTLSDVVNDMIGAVCAGVIFVRTGYNKNI